MNGEQFKNKVINKIWKKTKKCFSLCQNSQMPTKKKVKKNGTNVRIGDEVHRQLKEHTDENGLRMTKFVEKAILRQIKADQNS